MKVLQINAVYEVLSTGRNVKDTHEYLIENGEKCYTASPVLETTGECFYKIGSKADHKIHAFFSRLTGLQGYYSKGATKDLLSYIRKIRPDVILLHNLHGNYINIRLLFETLSIMKIPVVFVLHDCWFFTGKCVYYSEDNCMRWMDSCSKCPALKKGNVSWLFDRSKKMLQDKKRLYNGLDTFAVVGLSNWVTEDAKMSILARADKFEKIYNWIDLKKFHPDADTNDVRKKYHLENKYIILGVAAFWNEQKGIGIIKEIASELDDSAVIVLIGNLDERYKAGNIISIGRTDSIDELVSWYTSADVFINPSIMETFGKTTAESLACGTPVVGYAGTATAELVGTDGACGILVNAQYADEYYKAIFVVREKGKSYYKAKCRKRSEMLFDKDINLGKYHKLLTNLVSIAANKEFKCLR